MKIAQTLGATSGCPICINSQTFFTIQLYWLLYNVVKKLCHASPHDPPWKCFHESCKARRCCEKDRELNPILNGEGKQIAERASCEQRATPSRRDGFILKLNGQNQISLASVSDHGLMNGTVSLALTPEKVATLNPTLSGNIQVICANYVTIEDQE